jgi:hypothetical protein
MTPARRSFDDELARLFDLSHDAFCIAGFDGYLRRANPASPASSGAASTSCWLYRSSRTSTPAAASWYGPPCLTNAGWPTTSWARCAARPPWLRRAWRHLFDEVVVVEEDRTIGADGSRDPGVFVVSFVA